MSGSVFYRSHCRTHGAYDPYGAHPGNAAWVLAFNGERRDNLTGFYLLGNGRRAYSSASRRFLSADQLSPFSKGGINAYAYCLGDPVNRQDPSGAFSILSFLKSAIWLGSRIKAAWARPARLKVLAEAAKWTAGIGGSLAFYGVPGGKELATAGSIVKVGLKGLSVGRSLKKQVENSSGPLMMDLAGADFSPFVGPTTASESPSPLELAEQIRAVSRPTHSSPRQGVTILQSPHGPVAPR
ncbi:MULTISPECIES: RHS repeat-associated core domain-containing protein [Pseudomonas]|uniref:RHS repeat-associated core domain-containing protein n=1 Tax=Pseudomonas TaxID=286 RepID=UPI0016637089|nr:RHS repeat-associated core domain-containing protein [Pseudomonas asiatica]